MGYTLQQSQTAQPLLFTLLESGTTTGATGKSPTVALSKNGGSFAAPVGAVSEVGNGVYKVAANATDANTLGPLELYATADGCDPAREQFLVVAYDPQAASNLGLTNMDAAISSRSTHSAADVVSAMDADSTDLDAIKAKTDNLPDDPPTEEAIADAVVEGVEREGGMLESFVEPIERLRAVEPPDVPVVPIPDAETPGMVNVRCKAGDFTTAVSGVRFELKMRQENPVFMGEEMQVDRSQKGTTDATGEVLLEVWPSSALVAAGYDGRYLVRVNGSTIATITVPDAGGSLGDLVRGDS